LDIVDPLLAIYRDYAMAYQPPALEHLVVVGVELMVESTA
jgi:hypothetical protein